jgi:ketosteroid isomerase-like protein
MVRDRFLFAGMLAMFITAGFVQNTFPQSSDRLDARLRKAINDYDSAWNRKDVAGVSRVLADDYAYFSSTGGITDRRGTLEILGSPEYKLNFSERTEVVLLSSSLRNVIVVSSRWKGRGTYGKETIDDDQRCGLVFVKEDGTWKLLSEHCTQIVAR